jgi:hypothetical protein
VTKRKREGEKKVRHVRVRIVAVNWDWSVMLISVCCNNNIQPNVTSDISDTGLDVLPPDGSAARDSVSASREHSPYKEVFCFSVCQRSTAAAAGAAGAAAAGNEGAEGGFEMMFACPTHSETLAWVSSINSISAAPLPADKSLSDKDAAWRDASAAASAAAPAEGGEEADSDDDKAETSESMRRKVQAYMMTWLNLAPDDNELLHRHFCRTLQYNSTMEHSVSKKRIRMPFLNSPSVFPNASDGSCSVVETTGTTEPGQPYVEVTLISARHVPQSSDSSPSFEFMSGLHYMYCDMWMTPMKSERLRSSKQPRTENPVFRDELSFPITGFSVEETQNNIYLKKVTLPSLLEPKSEADVLLAAAKLFLHCNVYSHKPLSMGEDEVLGTVVVPIRNMGFTASPSEPVYDWFPLVDVKGELIQNAAVRLKIQLLV